MFNFWKKPDIKGKVSILIPTIHESRYTIELCLKSIRRHTVYPDYQIIVCDAGVDAPTRQFLEEEERAKNIRLIKAKDMERPKDDLVAVVDTPYYIIMHDDIMIRKAGWLTRRLALLLKNEKNAVVGSIVRDFDKSKKRFLPLALLVRTDVSRNLDLRWGKRDKYDTGGLAYQKFFSQKEYRFVPYPIARDIYHFAQMSWPRQKKHKDQVDDGITRLLEQREEKIRYIRNLLETDRF